MNNNYKFYLVLILSSISLLITCIFGSLILIEKNKLENFKNNYLSNKQENSNFNGKDGVNGTNGKDGINGTDGKDGINGTDGKDGVDGTDGKDGINGTDGKDGVDGTDGKDGVDGTDGKDGINGTNGKDGTNGTNGIDGKTPEFREYDGYIQWKYTDEISWKNLYAINSQNNSKGLVKYSKKFEKMNNNYISFADTVPITYGNIFSSIDGNSIKLVSNHYYYISLTLTSNLNGSKNVSSSIYSNSTKILESSHYHNYTTTTYKTSSSTIYYSDGNDLKINLNGCNDGICNIELTIYTIDL